ncbi:toll/interleukin-1 receptor domain-containing protein [Filobacillus milosensis]|uniref:Toll/interleukin-1 receptor domain-containing protein n=1 Tax=Filobacillus milosensis TaxID=94137 RepID=A0A4Y8IEL2_9BACI|nr:TIR domain-containing protein [Filobacillus milosensis]TFB13575.1 toll/interleukin-1 receptor domain-containing protein [Filobacillus milosensis]
MTVFLLHPKLTIGQERKAIDFLEACSNELQEHINISVINNIMALNSIKISKNDIFLFFNRQDQNYSEHVTGFFKNIIAVKNNEEQKSDLFPIAINSETRSPHNLLGHLQSFDITEQLRQRALNENYIDTIAVNLARTIVTRMQPTLAQDSMNLFISHRRLDGEEIAASFCKELRLRAESAFRDLIDIKVGENAQEVIEENLRQSDAVILLDTPKTWESDWIDREIRMALSINIPIVWIKLGEHSPDHNLKTRPSDKPHFNLEGLNPQETNINLDIIDNIIHKAFSISREFASNTFDKLLQLKSLTTEAGFSFTELDQRRMIYQVKVPREGFKYQQRPMTHLVQFYGRVPKNQDIDDFVPALNELGYEPHPQMGPYYDASILLGPMSGSVFQSTVSGQEKCFIDSFDEYIGNIEELKNSSYSNNVTDKGIIISGAFPDCEPEHQQVLTNAIHIFIQMALKKGLTIIFGAHPTFQHLIFDMAKMKYPKKYAEIIHMYISKYFVTESIIEEHKKNATVFPTDNVENDRQKSLTLMRKSMISDKKASALIALGGKTDAQGHSPGVEEEIELARAAGIPVFVIGSVGGHTAQIAKKMQESDWVNTLNHLSNTENKELMLSSDLRMVANKIFKHLDI